MLLDCDRQVLQLYQITLIHHGLMMVGPSGSGKSSAWRVLLKALERLEGIEGVSHVIDPKVCDATLMLFLSQYQYITIYASLSAKKIIAKIIVANTENKKT